MKTLKTILIAVFAGVFSSAMASSDTLKIKSSVQCKQCKERIENKLSFAKGVIAVKVDIKQNEVMIIFNSEKTSTENLKKELTKIGYDADELPADKKAYDKLPKCCQKGGMENHH